MHSASGDFSCLQAGERVAEMGAYDMVSVSYKFDDMIHKARVFPSDSPDNTKGVGENAQKNAGNLDRIAGLQGTGTAV